MKKANLTKKPTAATKNITLRKRLDITLKFRKLVSDWGDYDHCLSGMIGEMYAEVFLGLKKAKKGTKGYDGLIGKGRTQIKTKDGSIDSDNRVYFYISEKNYESFDCLLGVRILTKERNYIKNTLELRHIGPISKKDLSKIEKKTKAGSRYYLHDIKKLGFDEEIGLKRK
jgi:hypothetical protein